ncbi:MAG: cation diffusion facilitator family transporter [Byssovorax sp.]
MSTASPGPIGRPDAPPENKAWAHAAELEKHMLSAHRAGRIAATVAASLAVGKLLAGQLGHSVAVTASAVDSLMDVFASSANALAIRAAYARPDRHHPFGHAKIEALTTAGQGLLIGGSGIYLLIEGFRRLITPEPLVLATVTLGTMIASTVITAALVTYLDRIGKKTGSSAVKGDSLHYRTDIGANLAVLAGVAITYATGITRFDGALSILVAIYIFASAIHLLRTGVRDLIDAGAPEERVLALRHALDAMISSGPLLGYHLLRTRMAGRVMFIELHIELPGALPLREAHALGNQVRDALVAIEHDAQVLIHIDSERDEDDEPVSVA